MGALFQLCNVLVRVARLLRDGSLRATCQALPYDHPQATRQLLDGRKQSLELVGLVRIFRFCGQIQALVDRLRLIACGPPLR